jgi:DNA topoisomerase-6 subunit B
MYGLITTGKPMIIHTRPSAKKPAHHIELAMNTKTNRAEVTVDTETEDFPPQRFKELNRGTRDPAFLSSSDFVTGTSVSIELEGRYQRGRGSVDEFLELTAIANPHAHITFVPPSRVMDEEKEDLTGKNKVEAPLLVDDKAAIADPNLAVAPPAIIETIERDGVTIFPRGIGVELPPETKEIQPHPKGVELGTLLQMIKDQQHLEGGTLYQFLQDRFCRISPSAASTLCEKVGLSSRSRLASVESSHVEQLYKAFEEMRFPPPPTDCLAPIGVQQLLKGITKGVKAEFYTAATREAAVYRGRPFQIEAAIAFGGELPGDDTARVIRFANRVPLLFQPSACSSNKACIETGWRNYNLSQPRGSLPVGPLVIMIHMASVWVPFTSESKEAIADYDEIRKEMKLALMECGRKLGTYLRKRQAMARQAERRDVFERYIGEIAKAVNEITGEDAKKLYESLLAQAKKRTAIADAQLDEEGKVVRAEENLKADASVVLVETRMTQDKPEEGAENEPVAASAKPLSRQRPQERVSGSDRLF